jgi:hypothetical protein
MLGMAGSAKPERRDIHPNDTSFLSSTNLFLSISQIFRQLVTRTEIMTVGYTPDLHCWLHAPASAL